MIEATDNSITLPKGWVYTQLGDILEEVVKVQPRENADEAFIYLDIASIDNDGNTVTRPKRYLGKDAPSRARQLVRSGDILFSTVRTYLRNIALVPDKYDGQIASTGFCVIRPSGGISGKYLFYLVQADSFVNPLSGIQRGTSYPAVRNSDVYQRVVPVPPPAEQRRIVAKIEELFTRLDAGVEALKKVKAELKRYRQAVLKYAFEGKLTAEWRNAHKDELEPASKLLERIAKERDKTAKGKAKKLPPLDKSSLPELPDGWEWVRLDDIALVKGGITKDQKRRFSNGRKVPYLRVANVQRGYLDLSEITEIEASETIISDLLLKPGDILFTEGGDRDKLGRGCVWNGEIAECIYQNHIFRARLHTQDISSKLVSLYSNTFGQPYFMKEGKQTTNLASINMTQLRCFPIVVIPKVEQQQIVEEIDRHFSIADEVEQAIEKSLKQSDRLRQSILKKAFEGKLLEQNPEDEPAEELLKRIKAEKDKLQVKRKKSGRKNYGK